VSRARVVEEALAMVDEQDSVLGPIDYVVVEFAAGKVELDPALATELSQLVDAELIRVLDLMVLTKGQDGSIEVTEFEDLSDLGDLGILEGRLAEVLAADDAEHLGAALDPGCVGMALVWENTWAAPFAVAARSAGAQRGGNGRIPTQALLSAVGWGHEGE
jgi:hypothetical protein